MKIKTIDWIIWGIKTVGLSLSLVVGFVFAYTAFLSFSPSGDFFSRLNKITSDITFVIVIFLLTLILMVCIGFLEYLRMRDRY